MRLGIPSSGVRSVSAAPGILGIHSSNRKRSLDTSTYPHPSLSQGPKRRLVSDRDASDVRGNMLVDTRSHVPERGSTSSLRSLQVGEAQVLGRQGIEGIRSSSFSLGGKILAGVEQGSSLQRVPLVTSIPADLGNVCLDSDRYESRASLSPAHPPTLPVLRDQLLSSRDEFEKPAVPLSGEERDSLDSKLASLQDLFKLMKSWDPEAVSVVNTEQFSSRYESETRLSMWWLLRRDCCCLCQHIS